MPEGQFVDTRLVVIAYPRVPKRDYDWIQHVRAGHDMHYGLVQPHVTLVFPSRIDRQVFVDHVSQIASDVKPFAITLRRAVAVKDTLSKQAHVFLVPDRGFNDLVRLHDMLYSGILAPELRADVPFSPHLTVGNASDLRLCQRWADELNRTEFRIEGIVDALDVAELVSERVSTAAGDEEDTVRAVNTIERIVLG